MIHLQTSSEQGISENVELIFLCKSRGNLKSDFVVECAGTAVTQKVHIIHVYYVIDIKYPITVSTKYPWFVSVHALVEIISEKLIILIPLSQHPEKGMPIEWYTLCISLLLSRDEH